MPCMDYYAQEDERKRDHERQERLDRLSRIACNALTALEGILTDGMIPNPSTIETALAAVDVPREQQRELAVWWRTQDC